MFRIKGSIRNKLILFMLIATILPIVTSIGITYFYNKESVKKNTIRENSNLLFQGKTNLVHYLDIIDKATLAVYNDVRFYNVLQYGYKYASDQKNEMFRAIQLMSRSVNEIYQIHLDPEQSNVHFIYTNDVFPSSPKPTTVRPAPPYSGYGSYIEPTHMSHDYEVNYYPKHASVPVFTFHRPIYKIPSIEYLGLLSVDVRFDFIDRVSKQLYNPEKEQLYILNENGIVIYGSNQEEWGKPHKRNVIQHMTRSNEERGSFEWTDDSFSGMEIYEKIQTPYVNWILVKEIPYSHLYENARELTRINVGVFSIFLIIVIAATVFISIRFTSPIRMLISTINKIQSGQLNVEIDVRGTDEIGVLARRFRLMMQSLNELIVREYALELANKTNELKALQAQINPHFLNNALQSIGTLALQHQEIKIYSLIASLGKMMRYHMNADEIIVPLQKEIDYVKGYLELQQQRFDERLQVEIVTDPEAQQVTLPKMTLQPIVENYFKHGYDSTQGGQIRIECCLNQEGELRISVTDNGKGMEQEELEALRRKLEQGTGLEGSGADSIGLMNVISRIKLYFNEDARMNVSHAEPHGLKVELYIPTEHGNGGES